MEAVSNLNGKRKYEEMRRMEVNEEQGRLPSSSLEKKKIKLKFSTTALKKEEKDTGKKDKTNS